MEGVKNKNLFVETTMDKILETSRSFNIKPLWYKKITRNF